MKFYLIFCANSTVYRKKSFLSKGSDTKILQSMYYAYEVDIISSCSNRSINNTVFKLNIRRILSF